MLIKGKNSQVQDIEKNQKHSLTHQQSPKFHYTPQPKNMSRLLVVSMRGFHNEVYRSAEYEFEDIIQNLENANILAPKLYPSNQIGELKKKISNQLGVNFQVNRLLNSGCQPCQIQQKQEIFFFVCQHFWDITTLNSIHGWRENSRYAIAWIDEIWACELLNPKTKLCIELLKNFDYIFTTQSASADAIAKLTQRPCISIPYGIDAIAFLPYPITQERHIDVYSIGRRSPNIHTSLLNLAAQSNFLYIYDSLKVSQMFDYQEHRSLYRNLIQRTRYYIANKAKFDQPEQTGGQEEIGARFFEGAAAGSVMVGIPPQCPAFRENFDWEDAVIEVPLNTDHIVEILTELDAQPQRLQRIRRDNMINSLLRHDWVYRWRNILEILDLPITPVMVERIAYLLNLANSLYLEQI